MGRGTQGAANGEPLEGPWPLPKGWRWETLGNLVQRQSAKLNPDKTSDLDFVGMDNLQSHELRLLGVVPFRQMRSAASTFRGGDVLYGRLRPYLNKVWVADREGACSGELLVLRPIADATAEYIALTLHGDRFVDFATQAVTGDRPRIDFKQMAQFAVPVPPADVQIAMLEEIDELFEQMDEGEAAIQGAKKTTAVFRQALFKAAATGELTSDWRVENPPVESGTKLLSRVLANRRTLWEADPRNRRKKYVEPRSPDIDSLPDLPPGWIWATVQQLSTLVTSGSRGWSEYYAPEGALFIRAANLNQDRLDLSDAAFVRLPSNSEGMRTRVMHHDFLITITGANVTKCGVVDHPLGEAYVSQHVALVRPVSPEIGHYLYLWSRAYGGGKQHLEDAAYGAGKPGLNLPNIYEMVVALPPPNEQAEIAARVRRFIEQVSFDESLIPLSCQLRQSILTAAFRGDLMSEKRL